MSQAAAPEVLATVTSVSGLVRVKLDAGRMVQVSEGMRLSAGHRVVVVHGRVVLRFSDGNTIRLGSKTTLEITAPRDAKGKRALRGVFVRLVTGTVRALVAKLDPGEMFEIRSDTAIAAVKGTDLLFDGEIVTVFDSGDGNPHSVVVTSVDGTDRMTVMAGQSGGYKESGEKVAPHEVTKAEMDKLDRENSVEPAGGGGGPGQVGAPVEPSQAALEASAGGSLGGGQESMERAQVVEERNDLVVSREMSDESEGMEHQTDAHLGRIMMDMGGYRVRVEEYIFRPAANQVETMYLNSREGGPSKGLTFLQDRTTYNAGLPEDFQDVTRGQASAMQDATVQPAYWPVEHLNLVKSPAGNSLRTLTRFGGPEGTYYDRTRSYDTIGSRWVYGGESGRYGWGQAMEQWRCVGTSGGETLKEHFSWSKYLDLNGGWYAGASPVGAYPSWSPTPGAATLWARTGSANLYPYDPAMDNPATVVDEGRPDFGNAKFGPGVRTMEAGEESGGVVTAYGDGTSLVERYFFIDEEGAVMTASSLFSGASTKAGVDERLGGANIERKVEASEYGSAGGGESSAVDLLIDPRLSQ